MTRLAKSLVLVGIGLGCFALARLALLLAYPGSFEGLSAGLVLQAFASGLRFDGNVLLALLALPLALMNLPLRSLGRRWFDLWAWLGFAMLVPLVLLLGGDLVYFGYVQRHVADELLVIGMDADFLIAEAFSSYLPALLAAIGLLLGLGALWARVLAVPLREPGRPTLAFLLLAAGCTLGIRGTLDSKPLGLIDAYRSGNTALGNLSLNGAFSAFHASRDREFVVDHRSFSDSVAYAELGLREGNYPLLRRFPERSPNGRNLVVLLLESWDTHYLDSYAGGRRGITPHFDALATQGVRFENCYATGQRSIEAIQALLTGVPPVVGQPRLGWGLKLAHVTEIGSVARSHGYSTLFVQSSKRRSYRLDSAARSLGFEHVYGREDVPLLRRYPQDPPQWGWDYETLTFALARMDEFDGPFLAFVFTGSTHTPYPDPGRRFWLHEHTTRGEDGYVNVLHYSDWSLGRFFEAARSRPWFDRTLFVISSDHIFRKAPREEGLRADFRVPFLLYAPAILEPGVESGICSHLDGLPTFFALLGFPEPYATLGTDLLAPGDRFALVRKGSLMGIIGATGELSHSLQARLDAEAIDHSDLDALERRLLASVQVTGELLRANRWAPPSPPRRR